jgi:glycosyltransferase involved in cell wall biosynthesis
MGFCKNSPSKTNGAGKLMQISIVMAVKNETQYIQEALDSILIQESVEFEVIVVDDSSEDNTYEIVQSFSEINSHVKLFRSTGVGKVAAFNYGVKQAIGEYVCLFAGDDIMPAGSLFSRLCMLRNFGKHGPCIGLSKILTLSDDKRLDGVLVPREAGKGNPSGQSPLLDRLSLDILFPIPDELPNEDTWLEIAICHTSLCTIIHSDIICCNWRIHSGNSYNFSLNNKEFKSKIISRRKAYRLFLHKFEELLSEDELKKLRALVSLGDAYERSDMWKILFAPVVLREKLSLLGTSNAFFYSIRRFFYSFLSGW